jgi:tRNA (guanine-N7-)-methyltransferase
MIETSAVRPFNASEVPAPGGIARFQLPDRFSADTPLDLEIGCGVGWHPIHYTHANPDRFLVAIERTHTKFARFQSRLKKNDPCPNLLPVHADAVAWITHSLPGRSIDRCFLFYPNPNPKNASQRWLRMPFMHLLLDVLKPQGELHLATNEEWYAIEAERFAIETWNLRISEKRVIHRSSDPAFTPRTHFERKYYVRGDRLFDFVFKKQPTAVDAAHVSGAFSPVEVV